MKAKKNQDGANAKRATARTQGELAKRLGVSKMAVSKWTHRPDWPFGRRGPYEVDQVQAWRRDNLLRSPIHDEPVGPHGDELGRVDLQGAGDGDTPDANDTDVAGGGETRRLQLDNRP